MSRLFHVAYLAELWLWIPLAYFAATTPAARRRLAAPLVASVLAAVYEAYMTFVWEPKVTAPIRVDILLVIFVTGAADAISGLALAAAAPGKAQRGKWWAAAALCMSVPVLAVVGFAFGQREVRRLDATLDQGRHFLFEAAFRDDATEKRVFGNLHSSANPWAGYYLGDGGDDRFGHLVINDQGDFWLYHSMLYEYKGKGAQSSTEPDKFVGQGTGRMNAKMTLALRRQEAGPYLLQVDFGYGQLAPPKTVPIRRTDPPRFPRPPSPGDQVRFVGVFSGAYGPRDHDFWLVQAWLWESDGKVWGRYVHDFYKRGARREFISTEEIRPACARQCRELTFQTSRGPRTLTRVSDDEYRGTYGSPPVEVSLKRGETLPGFLLDLAPLATEKANREWIEAVSAGRMIEWDVP